MKDFSITYQGLANIVHRANTTMKAKEDEVTFHGHSVAVRLQVQIAVERGVSGGSAAEAEEEAIQLISKKLPTADLVADDLKVKYSKPLLGSEDLAGAEIFKRLGSTYAVVSAPVATFHTIAEDMCDWAKGLFDYILDSPVFEMFKISVFLVVVLEGDNEAATASILAANNAI